jgi:hypothetical protein
MENMPYDVELFCIKCDIGLDKFCDIQNEKRKAVNTAPCVFC